MPDAIENHSGAMQKLAEGLKRTVYQHENTALESPYLESKAIVIIAHGAGAGNQHEFMDSFCTKLAAFNIKVISFNFDYMQVMYETGKRRPPNPNKQLVQQFQQELFAVDSSLPVFIAGKSMGGRIATQLAATPELAEKLKGCIALGYPFMPPGKPEKFADRTKHFADLTVPLLINQGERDSFGNVNSLATDANKGVFDNPKLQLEWITSGDHSFKPLKASGLTIDDNINTAVANTVGFINKLL